MANRAKAKGRYFEHLIANTLSDGGVPAKRVPMSGCLAGLGEDLEGDVRLTETKEKVECKFRQNISIQLWDWLDDNKYLAVKRNHKEPLIIMPIDEFIRLKKNSDGVQGS